MYKQAIVNSLIKLAGIVDDVARIPGNIANGAREYAFVPIGNGSESVSERLGYTIGELFSNKAEDDDNLGPYKDVVKHIKDTELAEAYLRAAATMRRKARILKRKQKEEENLRNSVARSRFF